MYPPNKATSNDNQFSFICDLIKRWNFSFGTNKMIIINHSPVKAFNPRYIPKKRKVKFCQKTFLKEILLNISNQKNKISLEAEMKEFENLQYTER